MNNLIEFSDIDLGYGKKIVIRNLDFFIKEKTFMALVGPNGAGKTTILKAILGLLKPMKGNIKFDKSQVRFGYVPQREIIDEIYPLSVLDIVLMGRYSLIPPLRNPQKKDIEAAMNSLEYLGIKELAKSSYRDLSGGQKQRALIARALVGDPTLLVLDEPTNGMDIRGEKNIMDLVMRLHSEKNLTVVFVTHLLNLVANYAEEILLLEKNSFKFGNTAQILNDEILSNLYDMQIKVDSSNGQTVIVARGT